MLQTLYLFSLLSVYLVYNYLIGASRSEPHSYEKIVCMSRYVVYEVITHAHARKMKIVDVDRVLTLNVAHQTTEA